MSVIWLLFPIAYAADEDCINISPNVTDEDCGNLDITMEYYDANENCSQALFKEKFESFDFTYGFLYQNSFTAIFRELKDNVWREARNRASAKFENKDTSRRHIYQISRETTQILDTEMLTLTRKTRAKLQEIGNSLQQQRDVLNDATTNLMRTRESLQSLGSTISNFAEIHKIYVTIRARGNRVHLCNAELRRINANLMHRGVGGDDEAVLEECKDLLDKNLTQSIMDLSGMYCNFPEAEHQPRFLSMNGVALGRIVSDLTMTECIKHTNYPNLKSLSMDDSVLPGDKYVIPLWAVEHEIKAECSAFVSYVNAYLLWKDAEFLAQNAARITELWQDINREWSYVAEATETCTTEARTVYRKFKTNAELLAKAQACGQKMTEQSRISSCGSDCITHYTKPKGKQKTGKYLEKWTEDVEKCLDANKWKSVWLPWYNLYNLLGKNNNCVQIHNIIVGCVVTTLATVVAIFFVVSCLWRAHNCSCSCFRRSKPPRSRRRKYISDSDDSSDEEYYRRKRSLKARKKKGKSDGDEKKTRKHKDRRTVDKSHKKSKEEKNNRRDRRDGKRDKKKKTAESVRDDSRKAQRENCHNPEADIKMQWLRCGEPSQSSSWTADCELGLQPAGNAQLQLPPRAICIQTQPLKQDGFATVLENTRFHASPDIASMSTNDHLSVASGKPEFSRSMHLYQPNAGPRTERSNASRCEMNGGRSVAYASSTNSRRQSIESDLEAPGNIFHLPNLFPNKVISPPISTTFPQIRTSADSTTRFGMPFRPHVGLAHQTAMQRPSLTPPSSLAPIDLTSTPQVHTSLPMAFAEASGQTAISATRSEAATVTHS